MTSWEPTASIQTLQNRARIIKQIRAFFDDLNVIEVETPLLGRYGVTDPFIDNIQASCQERTRYLQTSPEYHMKRLLCAGMPSLFQITKAFRDEPQGAVHNPEFTMLEWYRLGMDYHTLMHEVASLLHHVLPQAIPTKHYTYQEVFLSKLGLCPFETTLERLSHFSEERGIQITGNMQSKEDWLSLFMTHLIEPSLADEGIVFIYDFPSTQASLSVVEGAIAKRFECYVYGIELANGFQELQDPHLQSQRFDSDNVQRAEAGLTVREKDHYLLDALSSGLPSCSGVALGIDRLIMLALNKQKISNVIAFDSDNA